jgi:hypothetical protein
MKIYSARDIIAMDFLRRVIVGGKYDLLANEATRDIFNIIKKNYQNDKRVEENFEYRNSNYIVDLYLSHDNLINQKFEARAFFYPSEEKCQLPPYIEARVVLDYSFSENDFERLYYVIYTFIRHEYDHFCKFDQNIHVDEEYQNNLRQLQDMNLSFLQRAEMVRKNVLNPMELDAYCVSIIKSAAKRHTTFQKVLREMMDIMFFGFSKEEQESGRENAEVMKIYKDIMDRIREKIEKTLQTKKIGMIVGCRFG